jgi:proliferating cell nuclear antigen
MDPANVAMIILEIPKSYFVEYDVKEETKVGINLTNLKQVLKRVVILNVEITDKITIKSTGNTVKTFTQPIIDTGNSEVEEPKVNPETSFTVDEKELKSVLADVGIVSDSLQFEIDKTVKVNAEGELNSVNIEVGETEKVKGKAKSKYSLEYMNKMLSGLSEKVKLSLNDNYPLVIEYEGDIKLKEILAPRVDND